MKLIRILVLLVSSFVFTSILAQSTHKIYSVAHRGASKHAPENTLASCQKAIEFGVDFIEMDLRETKDGIIILMHDRTVDRTTNGKGKVKELTWEHISQLDAGSWFGEEFEGTRVPTFREVLKAIKGKAKPDIDLKQADVRKIIKILKEEGYTNENDVLFHVDDEKQIKIINELAPYIFIRNGICSTNIEYKTDSLSVDVSSFYFGRLSKQYMKMLRKHDVLAFVDIIHFSQFCGVKHKVRKAIRLGVNYIQTDKLHISQPIIDEYNKKNP